MPVFLNPLAKKGSKNVKIAYVRKIQKVSQVRKGSCFELDGPFFALVEKE